MAYCASADRLRALDIDPSFDFSSGLSLLLVRPQLLLASLHHLVVLIGLRLSSKAPQEPNALSSSAFKTNFAAVSRSRPVLKQVNDAADELAGELRMIQEVAEKVRGLEAKLDYQIKKLVGLAQSAEAKGKDIVEDVTEGKYRSQKLPEEFD